MARTRGRKAQWGTGLGYTSLSKWLHNARLPYPAKPQLRSVPSQLCITWNSRSLPLKQTVCSWCISQGHCEKRSREAQCYSIARGAESRLTPTPGLPKAKIFLLSSRQWVCFWRPVAHMSKPGILIRRPPWPKTEKGEVLWKFIPALRYGFLSADEWCL